MRARPDYDYQPIPLDFTILEKLPEVGTIGGVHWKGRRVKDVADEITAELKEAGITVPVDSELVSSRMRVMHLDGVGIVKQFPGTGSGGTKIWARTKVGTRVLKQKEDYLG